MENSPYNQKIAEQLREINNRFLLNQDLTGKQVMEDAQVPLTKPNVSYGKGKSGGLIKTKVGGVRALGRAIGSGMAEMEGMGLMGEDKKKRGRPRKAGAVGVDAMAQQKNLLTGGAVGSLGSLLSPELMADFAKLKKGGKRGRKPKAEVVAGGPIGTFANMLGLGKEEKVAGRRRGRKPKVVAGGPIGTFANMLGLGKEEKKAGGFFDDVISSVGHAVKTAAEVAPEAIKLAKLVRGKGKKQTGAKGGAKKSSWVDHVKSYAKKHNISYKDALKKAGTSYK